MPSSGGISSAGELALGRVLLRDPDGQYSVGQMRVRVLDPRPHRDRHDIAATVSFVNDNHAAVSLLCARDRPSGEWRAIKYSESTPRKLGRSTIADAGQVFTDELRAAVVRATADVEPWAYEEPSREQVQMRELAAKLWASTEPAPVSEERGTER